VALVELNGQVYYQMYQLPACEVPSRAAGEAVRADSVTYYSAATGQVLADGNIMRKGVDALS
jgi:hypothetical protein